MSLFRSQAGLTTAHALVIAGVLIAVAVVVGPMIRGEQSATPNNDQPSNDEIALNPELAADLAPNDWVYGDLASADVILIEYSDLECPFCARVHPTLEEIVDESEGTVAWTYRHFPLTSIHPEAVPRAIAAECIGQKSGNQAFWDYIAAVFEGAPTESYTEFGITAEEFAACEANESILTKIDENTAEAAATGGTGTPHTIVANDEHGIALPGAQPKEVWLQVIEFVRTGELPEVPASV